MGWVTCTWQGHRRRYDRQDQGLTFILRKRRRQPPVVWWSYLAKTYGGAPAWYTTNHPVHIMVWSTLNMQSSKCHDKCLDSITVFTNPRAATTAKDAKDWSLPSFGSHLNPISTRGGGRLCPPYTGVHTKFWKPQARLRLHENNVKLTIFNL